MSASSGQLLASASTGALLFKASNGRLIYSVDTDTSGTVHVGYIQSDTYSTFSTSQTRRPVLQEALSRLQDDLLAASVHTHSSGSSGLGPHPDHAGCYFSRPVLSVTVGSRQYPVPFAARFSSASFGGASTNYMNYAACGMLVRLNCHGSAGGDVTVTASSLQSVPSAFCACALAISSPTAWPTVPELLSAPLLSRGGSPDLLGTLHVPPESPYVIVALLPFDFDLDAVSPCLGHDYSISATATPTSP